MKLFCFPACTNDKLHENSSENLPDDPHISSLFKSSDMDWCSEVACSVVNNQIEKDFLKYFLLR